MIVKLDSNDFVVSVEHEPLEVKMPTVKTQVCKGPWHYKGGKGTVLPLDSFPMNRYKAGTRTKTCAECLEKSGKRNSVSEREAETIRMNKIVETRIPIEPPVPGSNFNHGVAGAVHKWRVTVVKPTEEIVYAATYLEIAEEVQGEVVKVERLD